MLKENEQERDLEAERIIEELNKKTKQSIENSTRFHPKTEQNIEDTKKKVEDMQKKYIDTMNSYDRADQSTMGNEDSICEICSVLLDLCECLSGL